VAERAVQRLVVKAALDTPDVQRHSRGLSKIAGHSLPQAQLDIAANRVHVHLDIAVMWPVPVIDVARAVQRNVVHVLRSLGGFDEVAVDIAIVHLSAPLGRAARLQ
jgi:uncharacterized alkaline shock family protein YloU